MKKISPHEIAEIADAGGDISQFFTNKGKIIYPKVDKTNPTVPAEKQKEIDTVGMKLSVLASKL